jgi:hypothetical protein
MRGRRYSWRFLLTCLNACVAFVSDQNERQTPWPPEALRRFPQETRASAGSIVAVKNIPIKLPSAGITQIRFCGFRRPYGALSRLRANTPVKMKPLYGKGHRFVNSIDDAATLIPFYH